MQRRCRDRAVQMCNRSLNRLHESIFEKGEEMTKRDCRGDMPDTKILLPMAPTQAIEVIPPPRLNQPCVNGYVEGPSGKIPKVSSSLEWKDHWGAIKARFGLGRMHYTIDPGLYSLGQPDKDSPILVTANYKMSFDSLRKALPGRDAWILVLDTKGINVWCAAGKGTFGTQELVRRISANSLKDIVNHHELILPQLGAPGVAAHMVKKLSGFKVHYGPICAKDLPAYLDAGMKATPEMRRKAFPLKERAVLIPIELVAALKASLILIPIMILISGFSGHGGVMNNILGDGIFTLIAILGAIFAGAVLTPLLLPYLPGRAFTTKGLTIGSITALILFYLWGYDLRSWQGLIGGSAWILMISAIAAYLAMNFTGASTYTSLSGVRKEMHWALPLEIGTGLSGFAAWLLSRFVM
jgi:CO dehydrogenase/acetyl-CoA synthase delta subunit